MNLKWLDGACIFAAGILAGGYLFAGSQPRSFLALQNCGKSCLQKKDLAGLLTSVGIRHADGVLPSIVKESDRCLAIRHPQPLARLHYVFFPKKDIKNIADIAEGDQPYVFDCFSLIRAMVIEGKLRDYRVFTNGPGVQDITYLHFHLISVDRNSPASELLPEPSKQPPVHRIGKF